MKPFTADETSINCKSENNSFNDNSEIFTADDYVCIRITNHREDEEYVFGNFSKDTSDEEIRNYVEKKVREGYEYIIEHGDASDTGYFIFKEYYEKFYNRYLVFEDGKPIFKKI